MRRLSFSAAAAFVVILLFSSASEVSARAAQDHALTEKQKIERLIRAVENQKGATFICEKGNYAGRRAAAYLRLKLEFDGKTIESAREFIEFVPKPTVHDAPYEVRFSDGTSMAIKDFLTRKLTQIETGVADDDIPAPAKSPPSAAVSQPATGEQPVEEPQLSEIERRLRGMVNYINKRLGAYEGWPATRYIRWTHFGKRTHLWDKQEMRDRIEFTDRSGAAMVVVLDLNSRTGIAWKNGELMLNAEDLALTIGEALDMWKNDSFWMFMPYWLSEPGVKLSYVRMEPLPDDRDAHVIELTFEDGANIAPLPKYRIHAAFDFGLIEQWECYENVDDIVPVLTTPWTDWQLHGSILLATDHGMINGEPALMTDVGTYAIMPETAFTHPEKPVLPEPIPTETRMLIRSVDAMERANADALRKPQPQDSPSESEPVVSP